MNLAVFCPITSTDRGNPFEVGIPNGLAIEGVILADHVKNMDWRQRNTTFICKGPEEIIHRVLRIIEVPLNILEPFELTEILEDLLERFGLEEIQEVIRDIINQ